MRKRYISLEEKLYKKEAVLMKKKDKIFTPAETQIVFLTENVICKSGVWGKGDSFGDESNGYTDYDTGTAQ